MKRDLTERLDSAVAESIALTRFADWLRHEMDKVFLNGPLRLLKNFLSGQWLGHPLHPVLTDIPIGAWLVAIVLDLAALVLHAPNLGFASWLAIGLGIIGALGAIVTGLLDWEDVDARELTLGLVHAVVNLTATLFFTLSFFWRWTNHWEIDWPSAALALIGFLLLSGGAFLGGTLVFRLGAMVNRNAFAAGPANFVSVLATQDLPADTPVRVNAAGTPVLLVRRGEEVYAVGAVCSHFGGPLEEGKLIDGRIECPWHYSQFSLADGSVRSAPATAPLPSYETRLANGQVQVRLKT